MQVKPPLQTAKTSTPDICPLSFYLTVEREDDDSIYKFQNTGPISLDTNSTFDLLYSAFLRLLSGGI